MTNSITIVIPTYNEEANIKTSILSAKTITKNIFVLDSFSTDATKSISEDFEVKVIQNNWRTLSEKINWAAKNLQTDSTWIMRLDADETIEEGFINIWNNMGLINDEIDAFSVKRKFVFLGKMLQYGGWGSLWDVRIWRQGYASMEQRPVDEHLIVNGKVERLNVSVIDKNNKDNIENWISKHNKYSTAEASYFKQSELIIGNSDKSAKLKRFLKNNIYYKIPLFLRPLGYFIYKYFILFGFLDGYPGLIIHVLHSFWYRFIVDVKIYETRLNDK